MGYESIKNETTATIDQKIKEDGTHFILYYGIFSSGFHVSEKQLSIIFNGNKVWHHSLSNSAVKTHGSIGS